MLENTAAYSPDHAESPELISCCAPDMSRRNKDLRADEREHQDGARTPRSGNRQADWEQETVSKLSKYARIPPSSQDTPGRRSNSGAALIRLPDSEEEDSAEEGARAQSVAKLSTRSKSKGGKGTVNPVHADMPEPTLKDVLMAVNKCNTALSSLTMQFESFQEDLTRARHDIQKVAERTTRVENRVSEVEDMVAPLQHDVRKHNLSVAALLAKTDDLENRARRNNVRLVGVPEKVEGSNPSDYFETWILNTFGKETLTAMYAVERAHRVPLRPLPPGAPPRPVLVKLLHFKDRDIILRKARDLPDVAINGSHVSFYLDFFAAVQKRRMQFQDVKRRLRSLQVPYSMLYPAKLRVVALGSTRFFELPKDAVNWLDSHESLLKAQATAPSGDND